MRALRVSGALFLIALGSSALPTTGCGGDSGGGGSGTGGQSNNGSGGKSNSDAGNNSSGGSADGVPCGTTHCTTPEGLTEEPCCRDAFSSLCGVKNIMGNCAEAPKPPPKGCPSLAGFPVSVCCTMDGKCGVDLKMFGQGCIDIQTAASMAMSMGVPIMGQVPAAASCTPGDGGAGGGTERA